jgi:hypothetical protein
MRVGGSELRTRRPCGLSRDAVGQAHSSTRAVIVASTEETGSYGHLDRDRRRGRKAELGHVEDRLIVVRSHQTHEVIEDLRYPECGESAFRLCLDEPLDVGGGGLIFEESEDGEGVENDHFRCSRSASSILD